MLIQPYNSEWIKQFKEIEKIISSSLVDIHTSFEHIGGTSIKDLSSKPIIHSAETLVGWAEALARISM